MLTRNKSFDWEYIARYTGKPSLTADNVTNSLNPRNNLSSIPADCIVLEFKEYIPWNNPDNLVSWETEELVFSLKVWLFLPIMFLIGCPANIISMVVFYRQGLKERINVCLFALSFADEVYLASNVLFFCDQPYLQLTTKTKYGYVMTFFINNHLLGLHGFIWVSQVLSAIIASERCFCVMYPLRSHTFLRTSTMVVIIISVHIIILGIVFFEMIRYKMMCSFDPLIGKIVTIAVSSELYYRYQKLIDYLDVFVLGVGLPGLVLIVMIVTTILTTIKLRQAAEWRAGTSSSGDVSEKDIALTKMLVVNSVFFIVCLIPFIVFRVIFLLMPNLNAGGRQHNLYIVMQEILLIFSYFNSTFNIVIYYTMGSRYRQIFWQLFGRFIKDDKNSKITIS